MRVGSTADDLKENFAPSVPGSAANPTFSKVAYPAVTFITDSKTVFESVPSPQISIVAEFSMLII